MPESLHRSRSRPPSTVMDHGRGLRLDIEGMRAIAVGAVLAFHAGLPWFAGGFVGVDMFFVLSGFLITGLLAREVARSGRVRLGAFWARRARRLLPASAVVLAFSSFVTWALLPYHPTIRLWRRYRFGRALRGQLAPCRPVCRLPRRGCEGVARPAFLVARDRGAVLLSLAVADAAGRRSWRAQVASRCVHTSRRRDGVVVRLGGHPVT